jgi:Holliday junction resolvase RusA-like endonuclease
MTEHRVWLPFPPSVNGLFRELSPQRRAQIAASMARKGKKGRAPTRCLSKHYRKWRDEAHIRLLAAKIPRFDVPVVIKLELTPRDCRPRDADNYGKAVLDALVNARILVDDNNRYVKAVVPYWENPSHNSGVVVIIRPADMTGRREALTGHERKMLKRIRRAGNRLVPPGYSSNAIRGLTKKGYVRELPGLQDGAVQGYAVED